MDVTKAAGFFHFTLDSELEFPTWQAFIEDIKRMIPATERGYNPKTHEWTIAEDWWPTVTALRKKHFQDENQFELL